MSDDTLWEDGHSIFRPSYSATFLNCLGSLRPSMYAEDNAGEDAAIGTVFHDLMSEWQREGRPDYRLGEIVRVKKDDGTIYDVEVDEEMFISGEQCLEYVKNIPGERLVETRVDISSITPIPKQGGTGDLAFLFWYVLDITDWKYGRGVQVFAEWNTQLLLYAWGFFVAHDWIYHFKTIRMRIAQPRLNHWDMWEITREELIEWAEWAKERMALAWKRNAPRTVTPKGCQWCKITVDCPALEAARQQLALDSFDAIEEPIDEASMKTIIALNSPPPERELTDPVKLPTEQLAKLLRYRKMMETWFSRAFEELTARGVAGEDLGGHWKVVEGRTRRKYKDEDEAAERYSKLGLGDDDLYDRKLRSPNQLKKKLSAIGVRGKLQEAFINTMVYRPRGRPTLAPAGDNRTEIPNIIDSFEAEDE